MNSKLIKSLGCGLLLATSTNVLAQELEVTVTNLTQGIYFTPILASAHNNTMKLFSTGEMATPELQMMAEGGDISGLSGLLTGVSANVVENPAAGLLAPAMSTTAMLSTTDGNDKLSVVAMMLPTNDGFIGLNSWQIPTDAGTYTINVNAYDAGTEANDELVNGGGAPGVLGIPADPTGMAGTMGTGVVATEVNTKVHIHPGNLGDDQADGGKSDLNNTVHRWLNPVARITVVVK